MNMNARMEDQDYEADLGYRYGSSAAKKFDAYWNSRLNDMLEDADQVLEIGCGVGTTVKSLLENGRNACGIEISREFTEKSQGQNVINASAYAIPFADGSFDAVVYRGTLHHLDYQDRSLDEANRVLKDNGILLLSEPCNDPASMRFLRWLMFKPDYHEPVLTDKLSEKLSDSGFDLESHVPFGHLSFIFSLRDVYDIEGKFPIVSKCMESMMSLEENVVEKIPYVRDQAFHRIYKARKI